MPGATTTLAPTTTTTTSTTTTSTTTGMTTTRTTTTTFVPTTTTTSTGATTTTLVPTTSTTFTTTVPTVAPTTSSTATTTLPTITTTTATVATTTFTNGTPNPTTTTSVPATVITTPATTSTSTSSQVTILSTSPTETTTISTPATTTTTAQTTSTTARPTTTTTASTAASTEAPTESTTTTAAVVDTTTTTNQQEPSTPEEGGKVSSPPANNTGTIVGSVAAVAVLAFAAYVIWRVIKNKQQDRRERLEATSKLTSVRSEVPPSAFELAELELAETISGIRIDGATGDQSIGKLGLYGIATMATKEERLDIISQRNEALDKFLQNQRKKTLTRDQIATLETYVTAFKAAAEVEDLIYEETHPELKRLFERKENSDHPIAKDDDFLYEAVGLDTKDRSVSDLFYNISTQEKISKLQGAAVAAGGIKNSQAEARLQAVGEEQVDGLELQEVVVDDGLNADQVRKYKVATHLSPGAVRLKEGEEYVAMDDVHFLTEATLYEVRQAASLYEAPVTGLPEGVYETAVTGLPEGEYAATSATPAYAVPFARAEQQYEAPQPLSPAQKFLNHLKDNSKEDFDLAVALHEERQKLAMELISERLPGIKERYDRQCKAIADAIAESKCNIHEILKGLDPEEAALMTNYSRDHLFEIFEYVDSTRPVMTPAELTSRKSAMLAEADKIAGWEEQLKRRNLHLEPEEEAIADQLRQDLNLAGWHAAQQGNVGALREWFGLKKEEQEVQAGATEISGEGFEITNPLFQPGAQDRVINFGSNPDYEELDYAAMDGKRQQQPVYAAATRTEALLYDAASGDDPHAVYSLAERDEDYVEVQGTGSKATRRDTQQAPWTEDYEIGVSSDNPWPSTYETGDIARGQQAHQGEIYDSLTMGFGDEEEPNLPGAMESSDEIRFTPSPVTSAAATLKVVQQKAAGRGRGGKVVDLGRRGSVSTDEDLSGKK